MNLYKLTQDTCTGFDTYSAIIVAARNPERAAMINPKGLIYDSDDCDADDWNHHYAWAISHDQVKVKRIGEAVMSIDENTVILTSFNAG